MNEILEKEKNTTSDAESNSGHLIAVASGKGGVGKTWFSICLSQALAKQGKKVLLFDGDLGLANIDVQLGLITKHSLTDVIEGNLSLEHIIEPFEEGGFSIAAGTSGQGSLSNLPVQSLHALLIQIKRVVPKYDAVIIDLGAGIDRTVRFVASVADTNIVVTNDEPTSLTDAYAFIKLSHAAGHSKNIHTVINLAKNQKDGEGTYNTLLKACQNFLKITPPLLGIIRQDPKVKESIRAQTPFLTRFPNSEAAQDIEKIAQQIENIKVTRE